MHACFGNISLTRSDFFKKYQELCENKSNSIYLSVSERSS